MNETEALLIKAERSLEAARRLLQAGDADFAVSRAYYGYFYVAEALLLSKGLSFSRHGQVISQYGFHFAREEVLDRRVTGSSTMPSPCGSWQITPGILHQTQIRSVG